MPDLHHLLADTDLDFLDRVSRFWGIDLTLSSFSIALEQLENKLKEPDQASDLIRSLPEDALPAWKALLDQGGRMPSAQFFRQYGEIRVMGEAKRKREQPDLHPASPAEMLWYRALIGKGIFGTGKEPQEYVYIPDELLQLFGEQVPSPQATVLRPAADIDHAFVSPAGDTLLDALATLLSELRKGTPPPAFKKAPLPLRLAFMLSLLESSGLIHPDRQPDPDKSRAFLEKPRGESFLYCYAHWLQSNRINDLRMLPGLAFEGAWTNDPASPRKLLLEILSGLDTKSWWSIRSLITEIKRLKPDFQRPAGDYDSWFIRKIGEETFLRGFDAWDEVEGFLIRYLISGPLHWLGLLDLGTTAKGKPASSFKLSIYARGLLQNKAPEIPDKSNSEIKITSDGHFRIPLGSSLALHYQIGRFCDLENETPLETVYAITSDSLKQASEQGLKPTQLLGLLKRANILSVPPGFIKLVEHWEKFGSEIQLEKSILLRVSQPEILIALQKDPHAARYLGEVLSPQIIKVKPGSEAALIKILAENGYLTETLLDV